MTQDRVRRDNSTVRRERARSIAEILAIISRTLSARAHGQGLNPAQWSALRYFSSGISGAPTSATFADYEGISRASANQTVRAMIDKGLLERCKIPGERRAMEVSVTAKAKGILADDPIHDLAALLDELSDEDQKILSQSLYKIAMKLKP